nr:hypothetical protein [Cellvibrionaceae bacterium]
GIDKRFGFSGFAYKDLAKAGERGAAAFSGVSIALKAAGGYWPKIYATLDLCLAISRVSLKSTGNEG